MADSEADDPSFTSPSSALSHYRTLCSSLQSQLQSAEDDLRDLRELQDELESELERFEEGERGMRGEVEGLREEREEWKLVRLPSTRSSRLYVSLNAFNDTLDSHDILDSLAFTLLRSTTLPTATSSSSPCSPPSLFSPSLPQPQPDSRAQSKYLSALSSHSSTITHMQKELESLRSTERGLRDRLREVEVDNDDLEGRERATSSSLADLEARYNKSLERIALLEEELVGKARLEEECQRARDELRDLNEELAITKSQLDSATARLSSQTDSNATPTKPPPRRRTPSPPASPQTPTIEFVQPTPIPSRTTPTASNASPSKLPRPLSFSSSSSGSLPALAPAPLSRSTRLSHLPSLSSSSPSTSTASPSKLPQPARLSRSDTASMIREMQAMTGRVRRLTERLDQGRSQTRPRAGGMGGGRGSPSLGNLARAAGGGAGGGGGMTRSSTMRLPTTTSSGTTSSRPSSRLDSHPQTQSTRPPSRSALRASIGSSIRPPSRLSVSSTSTSTSGTSRAASPTPGINGGRPSSRLGLGRSVGAGGNPPVTGLGLASSVRARGVTHVRRQSSTSSSVSSTSGRSTPSEDPLRRSTIGLGLGRPSSALGQSQGPAGARRASGGFGLLGRRVSLANGRRDKEEVPPVPRLPGR